MAVLNQREEHEDWFYWLSSILLFDYTGVCDKDVLSLQSTMKSKAVCSQILFMAIGSKFVFFYFNGKQKIIKLISWLHLQQSEPRADNMSPAGRKKSECQ